MRKRIISVVVGGMVAGGLLFGTAQIAQSDTPEAEGTDPVAELRDETVEVKGGIEAPAPPRPLGEQLAVDPDPASSPLEESRQ